MSSMFGDTPAAPAAKPVTPMPFEDSEAGRRTRLRTIAKTGQSGGRQSTMLTSSRMGDMGSAETRSGYGSQVLTG
jgi:hypothetical protein